MIAIKDAVWFARSSWRFLGCDAGTGRHKARLRYLTGIVPKTIWFVIRAVKDRKDENLRKTPF